jgi:hypothetical protein
VALSVLAALINWPIEEKSARPEDAVAQAT